MGTLVLFIIFEVIPIFFGAKNTIKKNLHDLMLYNIIRMYVTKVIAAFVSVLIILSPIKKEIIDLTHLSAFSQIVILYFFIELSIYFLHRVSHTYDIPLFSKAHGFHHKIKDDLQWVNSRKEHFLVITSFVIIFSIFYYVVFKTEVLVKIIVAALYLTLNTLTHFHIPFSVPVLDKIFLFPKDHRRHHTNFSGPYGVTLSLFDTLFNTREKKSQ